MLRLDFHESGEGETIVITFPGGGVGVVDAHPSPTASRPDIVELLRGKRVHFICLTHPHADHGKDIERILRAGIEVESFWHTISELKTFFYSLTQTKNYPGPLKDFVNRFRTDWARFLVSLFHAVQNDFDVPMHQLRADLETAELDGVEISCLSPEESVQQEFTAAYRRMANGGPMKRPDPNRLSAILALRYQGRVALLGADALRENWSTAAERYRKRGFPKAELLKVPHHGATNAFLPHPVGHEANYLDLTARKPSGHSVLFAGDADHPAASVYERLRAHTEPACLVNGLMCPPEDRDPLNLAYIGARAATPARRICNPTVSYEIGDDGALRRVAGVSCDECPVAAAHEEESE